MILSKREIFFCCLLLIFFSTPLIPLMREVPKSFTAGCIALREVNYKIVTLNNTQRPQERYSTASEESSVPIKIKPLIFAKEIKTDYTPNNSGTWEKLMDGAKLWRLRIISEIPIKSLNLGITGLYLPPGVKLWIYNFDADYVEGPYQDRDKTENELWTPIIPGKQIVVEVFVPACFRKETMELKIKQVNLGNREVDKREICNVDIICSEADRWRDQIRSVVLFTLDGKMMCSGILLNNTAKDFKPYILTANHSGVTLYNVHTIVVYWNYQSPNCSKCGSGGKRLPGSLKFNQTGAILRAQWDEKGIDFTLLELKEKPDPYFNVYYSGWDARGCKPNSAIGIHHPARYEKSFNLSKSPIFSTCKNCEVHNPKGCYWCVEKWDYGAIQNGSSGSGLWDQETGLCIGQLSSGLVQCQCDDPCVPKEKPSWYGKFSVSWEGGGKPETQLKYWLDPINSGIEKLNGADPLRDL